MRLVSASFVVLLSSVLTTSVAIAASSLAGETFTGTWTIASVDVVPAVTANCVDLVSGTVKYFRHGDIGGWRDHRMDGELERGEHRKW